MTDNTNGDSDPATYSSSIATLQKYAPHPYQSLNSDGEILTVNDAWLDILGYDREEVEGRWFGEFLANDSVDEFQSRFPEFKSNGGVSNVEFKMQCADGEIIVVSFDGTIEYDDDGSVIRTHCQFAEITDRKEREQNLERFKKSAENAGHAIYFTDPDGTIEYVNSAFEQITGYAAEEALGKNPRILKSGEMPDGYYERLWESVKAGEMWEEDVVNRRKNGELYHAHQTIAPVLDEDEDIEDFVAIQTDITEEKEREQEIQDLSERLKLAVEGANLGIWDWDVQTDEVDRDELHTEMLGYTPEEMGDLLNDWERLVHPEGKTRHDKALAEHIEDQTPHYQCEYRLKTATGDWKWVRTIGKVVDRDENGNPIRAVGIHLDINDRKEREQQLRRQKERLENFANVVSHDLRNPLNVSKGRIEIAREKHDSEHLEAAAEGIDRSFELIDDLLALARGGQDVSDREAIELGNFVGDCWETVETPSEEIEVDVESTIHADRSRLRQLFENLFRNSVEHGGEDVKITVGSLPDGFYVEDDGSGIPEDEREDVFKEGYSKSQDGTGFGLSIVQQIVEAHGWNIRTVEGSAGGARFEITGVDLGDE